MSYSDKIRSRRLLVSTMIDKPKVLCKEHLGAGAKITGTLEIIKGGSYDCRIEILRKGKLVYATPWLKKKDFYLHYEIINEGKYEIRVRFNRAKFILSRIFRFTILLVLITVILSLFSPMLPLYLIAMISYELHSGSIRFTALILGLYIFVFIYSLARARSPHIKVELFCEEERKIIEMKVAEERKVSKEKLNKDFCPVCGAPREPGSRYCLKCIEQAARNVEGFADILETRGCIRAAEALNLLLRHVVGPIRPLERSFGHLNEFRELKKEVDEERAFLEIGRSEDRVLDDYEVRRLRDKARSWAVRIRNLHLE